MSALPWSSDFAERWVVEIPSPAAPIPIAVICHKNGGWSNRWMFGRPRELRKLAGSRSRDCFSKLSLSLTSSMWRQLAKIVVAFQPIAGYANLLTMEFDLSPSNVQLDVGSGR